MSSTHNSGKSVERQDWEEIYKTHSPVLFGFLARKVGQDMASDILQESFLRLIQELEKERRIENVKAYLFQIARNLLYKEYKGNHFVSNADVLANFEDHSTNMEAGLYKKELVGLLESAKQTLSASEQEIFELRWIMNFTQLEIAHALSRSERQIRRDLEKIARKVRIIFQNAGWTASDLE